MVIGLLFSCAHSWFEAYAETVSIFDVPFRVDSVRPIDAESVEVSVGSERRIVSKAALQDAVVELTFAPNGPGISMDPERIATFVEKSLSSGKLEYAGLALPSYLASPQIDTLEARDIVEEFAKLPKATEAFKSALLTIRAHGEAYSEFRHRPDLVAVVLFVIGLEDGVWLRSNGFRWVFAFSESLRGYVLDRLARAVVNEERELIRRIPNVVRDSLGDEDPFFRNARLLSERVLQVLEYNSDQAVETLYPLVEATRRDADTLRILYPLVSNTLHDVAEQRLMAGRPAEALMVISRTDVDRRTPRTHEVILRALEQIPHDDRELVRDVAVERMLTTIALRDAEVRTKYEAMLEAQILEAARTADVSNGSVLLSKLTRIRSDPDPRNDDLRIELALAELRLGSREGALTHLSGVRLGIPMFARLKLGLAGLYVNRLLAFFCIVVPAIYVVWFAIVELRRLRDLRLKDVEHRLHARAVRGAAGKSQDSDSDVQSEKAGMNGTSEVKYFIQGKLNKPTDPRLIEYAHCLLTLGLQQTASLSDIKNSYRGLVKQIHPDRLQENKGLASDRFIEITQAYDRALELRRLTGIEEA